MLGKYARYANVFNHRSSKHMFIGSISFIAVWLYTHMAYSSGLLSINELFLRTWRRTLSVGWGRTYNIKGLSSHHMPPKFFSRFSEHYFQLINYGYTCLTTWRLDGRQWCCCSCALRCSFRTRGRSHFWFWITCKIIKTINHEYLHIYRLSLYWWASWKPE